MLEGFATGAVVADNTEGGWHVICEVGMVGNPGGAAWDV
jgi:hypothetical protein